VKRARALILAVAGGAGRAVRTVPGIAGAVLIVVGFGLAWLPLGFIVAGAFLVAVDARIPAAEREREQQPWPDGRVRPVPPPSDRQPRLGVVA
jgi:hypothetical protein